MNKYSICTTSFFLLIVLTMVSCGSKNSQLSGGLSDKEKTELIDNLDYKKASELKEFSTAYMIVDKLKEVTSQAKREYEISSKGNIYDRSDWGFLSKYKEAKKKSDEAEKYVVLQETMSVLESAGTNGLERIVGIVKEHKAERWLYSELIDIAKKIDDTELEEMISNIRSASGLSDLDEGELIPSQTSITGPLNGYFKVVEKKYKCQEKEYVDPTDDIFVEIERIKKGLSAKEMNKIALNIEFIDEKGNVIENNYYGICPDEMIFSNVGEAIPVRFYISFNSTASKFRILSKKKK